MENIVALIERLATQAIDSYVAHVFQAPSPERSANRKLSAMRALASAKDFLATLDVLSPAFKKQNAEFLIGYACQELESAAAYGSEGWREAYEASARKQLENMFMRYGTTSAPRIIKDNTGVFRVEIRRDAATGFLGDMAPRAVFSDGITRFVNECEYVNLEEEVEAFKKQKKSTTRKPPRKTSGKPRKQKERVDVQPLLAYERAVMQSMKACGSDAMAIVFFSEEVRPPNMATQGVAAGYGMAEVRIPKIY